ncbi:MAG: peptidoglycan-binding protein [Myxococcaceae bacterium]|nr:peptidoglycan-binding protein [Myxococcaceae bacterium]
MARLHLGSRGLDVERMELQLRRLGLFDGAVDGRLDQRAERALKAYERQRGIPADGTAGVKEQRALKQDSLETPTHRGLHRGDSGKRVANLKRDLFGLGLVKTPAGDRFQRSVAEAVKRFERQHHLRADGVADLKTERLLHRAANRVPRERHPHVARPPADYHHVHFRGVTLNERTKVMLQRAELYAHKLGVHGDFGLVQGSYHPGVAASAGTHDGGGAMDVSVAGRSHATQLKMVKALRLAGFAAWTRGPADGFSPHIHAIAIGDRDLAPLARQQVHDYFAGRNGLASNLVDPDRAVGRPYPRWAAKHR